MRTVNKNEHLHNESLGLRLNATDRAAELESFERRTRTSSSFC